MAVHAVDVESLGLQADEKAQEWSCHRSPLTVVGGSRGGSFASVVISGSPRFEPQGEQHDVFAGAMEIAGHGDAVHELIAALEGEPEAAMEGDRRRVEGARLGRGDRSAGPANG